MRYIAVFLLALIPSFSVFADNNEETVKKFIEELFAGNIESSVKLSGLPFSYDGRELITDTVKLKEGFEKITDQNGTQKVNVISIKELEKTRGKHRDLKEDIIIYEVKITMKKSTETLQIFVRKSDGKVVGLYG